MISDFVALILQASGGAILGGKDQSTTDAGLAIIKTGLAAHLVAIAIFVMLAAEYGFRAYRHQDQWDYKFSALHRSRAFLLFLIGIYSSVLSIPRIYFADA